MANVWPRPWKTVEDIAAQCKHLIEKPDVEAFLVLADGEVAGSTTFYDMKPDQLAIGWTFYLPKFRRTAVNTSTKLQMLGRAFDEKEVRRVQFDVDGRNITSQAAVLRLGATHEGTLRQHKMLHDGFVRDTCIFSILREEWPTIRDDLTSRLRRSQSWQNGTQRQS